MIVKVQPLGYFAGSPPFSQVEEVGGGLAAAGGTRSTVGERILIGVATGLIIYVGHRILDALLPPRRGP